MVRRMPETSVIPINKVVYGDKVLIDLTEDTVTTDTLLAGVMAHNKTGAGIIGAYVVPTIQEEKGYAVVANGDQTYTITPDNGYDAMRSVMLSVSTLPTLAKTASGSITFNITSGANTFTLGTVSFTPIACGWYFNESNCRGMATKDPNGTSRGVGVNTGTSVSTTSMTPTVSVSDGTITGSFRAAYAARNATISWWAVGNG